MNQAIPRPDSKTNALYLALELGRARWILGFATPGHNVSIVPITGGDRTALLKAIARAKQRFGFLPDAPVRSCYEAGRDGFWIDRYLRSVNVENLVVDSSSIEVNRRGRRQKTDRLDAAKLVSMLIRYFAGERKLWSVVRVPTVEQEDRRRLTRELERLKKEQTAHRSRIRSLLWLHGIDIRSQRSVPVLLQSARLTDGSPLPEGLVAEVQRELLRLDLVRLQIRDLEKVRRQRLESNAPEAPQINKLQRLLGVGIESSSTYVYELFAWRAFRNRREVACLVGLTPSRYQSGDHSSEQGITRAGNGRVRRIAVQIAWGWLRFQPKSTLSIWFQTRFGHSGGRMKRIGIVAMARRLLIALWRFLERNIVPEGATLRPAAL